MKKYILNKYSIYYFEEKLRSYHYVDAHYFAHERPSTKTIQTLFVNSQITHLVKTSKLFF